MRPVVLRALLAGVVLLLCAPLFAPLFGGVTPARADTPGARLTVSPGGPLRPGDVVTIRGTGHTGCPTGRIDLIGFDARLRTNVEGADRLIAADVPLDPDHGFTVRFTLDPPIYLGNQGFRTLCTNRGAEPFLPPMAQTTFEYPASEQGNPNGFPKPGPPPANLASRRLVVDPADAGPDRLVTVWTDLRCGAATANHNGALRWDGRFVTTFYAPAEPTETRALRVHLPQTPTRGTHRLSVACLSDDARFGVVDAGVTLDAQVTFAPATFTLSAPRAGGDRIRASGAGFTGCAAPIDGAPAEVALRRGDRVVARVPVGADGRIDAELTLPADLPEGPTELTAGCAAERLDGTVRFAFTVLPGARTADALAPRPADRADSALDLPSPGDLLDHPGPLVVAGAGTALALPLVGFAAELVNKTIEENRLRIRRRLRPGAARPRSMPRAPRLQVLVFLVLSALCTVAVEPTIGFDRATYALALSMLIAVPLTVLAYSGPAELYRRRLSRVRAFPQLIPGALVVAVLLGVVSRTAHLVPGYVYGLFLAFTHAGLRQLPAREEGRATALGAWALAGLGAAAWVSRIPVEHVLAGDDSPAFGWVLAENVLTQIYIAAMIGLVFGLLPITWLDGQLIWRWNRWAWAAVYAVAVFLFLLTLLDPTGVTTGATRQMWTRAVWVFGTFCLVSVGFWAVFRLRPAPPPGPPGPWGTPPGPWGTQSGSGVPGPVSGVPGPVSGAPGPATAPGSGVPRPATAPPPMPNVPPTVGRSSPPPPNPGL
ncbi:FGLLP motif-containing membrane protein [Embleya sp. NPDC059237]|uniref:FGLLP motif-containing membrane protein n=1 Tax=Embleya sp. NPDC059237 TaxID=3346784 RepID=UPI003697A970